MSSLVRSLATKVAFPALLLANMQILTMVFSAWLHPKCLLCNVITDSPSNQYIFGQNVWKSPPTGKFHLRPTIGIHMKARVYVTLKPSVLDPQGQTIRSA